MVQVTEFTPDFQSAETEKEKLSRTDVRNISQKFNRRVKLSWGEESQVALTITAQACQTACVTWRVTLKKNGCCANHFLIDVFSVNILLSSMTNCVFPAVSSEFQHWAHFGWINSNYISLAYQIGIRCGSKTILSIRKVAENQSSDTHYRLKYRKCQRTMNFVFFPGIFAASNPILWQNTEKPPEQTKVIYRQIKDYNVQLNPPSIRNK